MNRDLRHGLLIGAICGLTAGFLITITYVLIEQLLGPGTLQ